MQNSKEDAEESMRKKNESILSIFIYVLLSPRSVDAPMTSKCVGRGAESMSASAPHQGKKKKKQSASELVDCQGQMQSFGGMKEPIIHSDCCLLQIRHYHTQTYSDIGFSWRIRMGEKKCFDVDFLP